MGKHGTGKKVTENLYTESLLQKFYRSARVVYVPGFLPIFILLSAAIAVIILSFVPRGIGIAWFLAAMASIGAWIAALLGKAHLPYTFFLRPLLNLGIQSPLPSLSFDLITWPVIVTICGLTIGVLVVSSARIGLDANCREWAGILGLGVLGLLGGLSANILTSIIVLSLYDLTGIFTAFYLAEPEHKVIEHLKRSIWNLFSLILFIVAFGWQLSSTGAVDDWKAIQPGPGNVILVACMMRMVLIPFKKWIGTPAVSTNGIFIMRYIINLLISAAIVLQLPFNPEWSSIRIAEILFLLLVVTIGSIRLFHANNESRPALWRVFIGSLICAEYLYGYSAGAICFTITAIVLPQILFLDYPVSRFTITLGVVALAGFSGFPFTPDNTGLSGFIWAGKVPGLLFLLPALLAFYAYLRNLFEKKGLENPAGENWTKYLSQGGLLFPLVTPWIIILLWQPDMYRFAISIPAMIMSLGGTALFVAERAKIFNFQHFVNRTSLFITNTFRSRIKSDILQPGGKYLLQDLIQQPFDFISGLFEGDGGFIWAILCLVLVITILRSLGLS